MTMYSQKNCYSVLYRSCYRIMEENSYEPYPDLMQLHFIEMPKFVQQEHKQTVDVYDRMAKWLRFLTNKDRNHFVITC